jgi:hypothetical protein
VNQSRIGDCGLCSDRGVKLVDSHIYPRWMGRDLRPDGPLVLVTNNRSIAPRALHRHGAWERIVCSTCEGTFLAVDTYFAEFSRARDQGVPEEDSQGIAAYYYPNADAILIQRFFLTCLYRAHLARQPMWSNTDLGPFAGMIRGVLKGPALFDHRFETVLFREQHDYSEEMAAPMPVRVGGSNAYQIHVPGFSAIVRTDKQAFPPEFSNGTLHPSRTVFAFAKHSAEPDKVDALHRAIEMHRGPIDRIARAFPRRSP